MTDRESFEEWYKTTTDVSARATWVAATLAERGRCAELCEKSDRYRGDYFATKIRGE